MTARPNQPQQTHLAESILIVAAIEAKCQQSVSEWLLLHLPLLRREVPQPESSLSVDGEGLGVKPLEFTDPTGLMSGATRARTDDGNVESEVARQDPDINDPSHQLQRAELAAQYSASGDIKYPSTDQQRSNLSAMAGKVLTLGDILTVGVADCTALMSYVARVPYHSTLEWTTNSELRDRYFDTTAPSTDRTQGPVGAWTLGRYKVGSPILSYEGHTQMSVGNGQFADSTLTATANGPRYASGQDWLTRAQTLYFAVGPDFELTRRQ